MQSPDLGNVVVIVFVLRRGKLNYWHPLETPEMCSSKCPQHLYHDDPAYVPLTFVDSFGK